MKLAFIIIFLTATLFSSIRSEEQPLWSNYEKITELKPGILLVGTCGDLCVIRQASGFGMGGCKADCEADLKHEEMFKYQVIKNNCYKLLPAYKKKCGDYYSAGNSSHYWLFTLVVRK